eukprot:CAMPEP_0202846988 /NCGR_PEP_ID=MMETSP1389-20130828/74303_1 /ASSEMBLY_ACC=CAM_ASM_000865 /TAXON_ID=302021 /ORGANISM="Rhodomonas sp., Strain CCMP768" /LENGTH=98 /DNA_ID=CAMNT_0049524633 /DNA_START=84 /DNA_END=380 /DNA_ORIENTATION=-
MHVPRDQILRGGLCVHPNQHLLLDGQHAGLVLFRDDVASACGSADGERQVTGGGEGREGGPEADRRPAHAAPSEENNRLLRRHLGRSEDGAVGEGARD